MSYPLLAEQRLSLLETVPALEAEVGVDELELFAATVQYHPNREFPPPQ